MSSDRRPQLAQRRRRVIYAHGMEAAGGVSHAATAASRQARRPTAAYGSRVHRRLRARWFGLVPVRRRSLSMAIAVVTCVAAMLTLGHWAAIRWAPLAYAPEIARPLRLDRPDSFGTWLGTLLLFSAAGAAFLIYQLRRYRSDDYQGRYRIWRPVILLLAVACLDSVVGLVDWGGHLLDACLGERKALSGGNWIRLLLTIGGAGLGLRMLAEVWKSRVATIALGVGALALAYPALVHWKILQVDSPLTSTLYSSAPLWTRTAIWVAMLAYLRLLYREVRQIDAHDRLADRMRNLKLVRLWNSESTDEPTDPQEKPSKTAKTTKTAKRTAQPKPQPAAERQAKPERTGRQRPAGDEQADDDEQENQKKQPKRRWFGLRKPAPQPIDAAERDDAAENADDDDSASQETRPRRRWFGLRKPANAGDADQQAAEDQDEPAPAGRAEPPSRSAPSSRSAPPSRSGTTPPATESADSGDSGEELDPDSIDWSSLNKAERRRLRRELKRQGKAA